MKVLLLATHLNIGGVAVYAVNLAKGLKKKGASVYVASAGGDLVKVLEAEGIPHLKIRVKTKFEFHPKLIFVLFKLFKFVKRNKIEVIHAQTRVTQILGESLSVFTGVHYVSTCHGFFKHSRIGRKIFGAWGRRVIAISDAVRDHLINDFKVKKENVSLIYNGVDAARFAAGSGDEGKGALRHKLGFEKSPVVGSISRLSPVKGLKYLLFAMKDILREMPEARLLLVGEGPSKERLKELAGKLGIEKNVFFASNTMDTRRFLAIINVFVFYSLEEGLGLSLLEAMAAGKPCVASGVGGISSVIEDNVTGLLVPPKDPHALKEGILKVLKDAPLGAYLAEKGKALIKKKFSLEKMVTEVMDVYQEDSAR